MSDCSKTGGGGSWVGGGGLSSSSKDSYFSDIFGNDAEKGLIFHCPKDSTL
jgi:hypothetical protein